VIGMTLVFWGCDFAHTILSVFGARRRALLHRVGDAEVASVGVMAFLSA
jgi:hypothetical protein